MGIDGEVRITNTGSALAWSPDGDQFAYYDYDTRGLYVIHTDGWSNPELIQSDISALEITWSPDGTKIAYSDGIGVIYILNALSTTKAESSIAVISIDGSDLIQLTPNDRSRSPEWSPNGSKIAFGREGNIFLMNSDGTNTKPLVQDGSPTWSPDGTRIAYISAGENSEYDESGYFDQTGFCTNQLRVINIDGSNMIILRDKAEFILSPAWAPKNKVP